MKPGWKGKGIKGRHRVAAAVALAAAGTAVHGAPCDELVPGWLVERVMSARCTACWAAAGETWVPPAPAAVVLDWIVPAGDDAPLQAAAVPEARDRWPGGPGGDPAGATHTAHRAWPLAPRSAPGVPRLRVQDGPAWNGYIGVSLQVSRPLGSPAAARPDWSGWSGHLALVEQVPAGDEGSAVPRQVVRGVVGPLPLAGLARQPRLSHLQAVRLPAGGQAARWKTLGWLSREGEPQVVAWAGQGDCGGARTPR